MNETLPRASATGVSLDCVEDQPLAIAPNAKEVKIGGS
jgi:hypothetical protein